MRKNTFIFMILGLFCWVPVASAAIFEKLPIAYGAKDISVEESLKNSYTLKTTGYTTEAKAEDVIIFYKKQLALNNWQLVKDSTVGASSQEARASSYYYPGDNEGSKKIVEENPKRKNQPIDTFYFTKGNAFISLVVADQEERGRFVTAIQGLTADCKECSKDPNVEDSSLAKDLQFVPRYPGSLKVGSEEKKNPKRIKLTYTAQAGIDDVADYFLSAMPSFDWKLEHKRINQNVNLIYTGLRGRAVLTIVNMPGEPDKVVIGVSYEAKK
jgi:hypothetical protein